MRISKLCGLKFVNGLFSGLNKKCFFGVFRGMGEAGESEAVTVHNIVECNL